MSPASEGLQVSTTEQISTAEHFSVGEQSARLSTRQDAVCDGKRVLLAAVERGQTPELKQTQRETLATTLNGYKKSNSTESLLGHEVTAEMIAGLDAKLAALTNPDTGKFAGLLVNILSASNNKDVASLGMVAFVDYLINHQDEPAATVLANAHSLVEGVYLAARIPAIEPPNIAAALLNKNGTMTSVTVSQTMLINIYRNNGTETTTTGGINKEPQEEKVADGDQIILCTRDASSGYVTRGKSTEQIVREITTEPTSDHESAASGGRVKAKSERVKRPGNRERRAAATKTTGTGNAETSDAVEVGKHKPPFFVDNKKDPPVKASEYIISMSPHSKLTAEEWKQNGISVDSPPSYVIFTKEADEGYSAVINIFEASREWTQKVMEKLSNKGVDSLSVPEQIQLLERIHERLTWEGDDETIDDRRAIHAVEHPLTKIITNLTQEQIMTVEVMIRQLKAPTPEALAIDQREKVRKGLLATRKREPWTATRSMVAKRGGQVTEEGEYQNLIKVINGHREVNQLVQNDILAAELMLDTVSDLKVNIAELSTVRVTNLLEGVTYRQAQEQLREAVSTIYKADKRNSPACQEALRTYNRFLKVFYDHVYEALRPDGIINTQDVRGAEITKQLSFFDLSQAINSYKGTGDKAVFKGLTISSVREMALKGMELKRRQILDPLNFEIIPQQPDLGLIYNKTFIQSEAEAIRYIADPPPQPPPGEGGKGVPVAPASEKPKPPVKAETGLPVGPVKDEKPEPPVTPEKGAPVAPVKEGEQTVTPSGIDPAPPGGGGEKTPELQMDANVAAVAIPEAAAQNIQDIMKDVLAADLTRMRKPGWAKIPILGGVLYSIRHPIKLIWQNNIARSVFEQQALRFGADFRNIMKGTDRSVPVEVSTELINLALAKGREIRSKQGAFRRGVWAVSDFVKGITGLSQTSEMILAKQWLNNEMTAKRATRASLSDELKRATSTIYTEQTALGDRFALMPDGLNLEEANAHVLAYRGETRHSLAVDNPGSAEAVNKSLRAIVMEYCTNSITQEELVGKVNAYFKSDAFRNLLPEDQRRMMQSSELATNIITVAEMVRGKWGDYSKTTEEGGKAFDKFAFNILYGKGEWGGVRAHTETSFLTEVLARRLAERSVGGAELGYAASLTNDFLTYGGAFAAAWGSSALNTLLNKIPSALLIGGTGPIGGVLGMGAMSTIKETGFSIPLLKRIHWNWAGHEFHPFSYIGRTAKDAGQASREAARGALEGAKGTIRSEMERTLVKRKEAVTLTTDIQDLLLKVSSEQMSNEQAMELLTTLADIDARMRLSDLSGTVRMNYHTQNYIGFTGGSENEQYLALKKALLDGIVQLKLYGAKNPTFMKGQGQMFTQYGTNNTDLGLFEKMSGLAEAQLRVSSEVSVVSQWMRRELHMSSADVAALVNGGFFADQRMISETTTSDSLRTKEANLRRLTLKRGASTLVRSVITAPVAGFIYGGITNVVGAGVTEIGQVITEGPKVWAEDWGKVLSGNIPITTNASGGLVVDLSPIQRASIVARNIIEPPLFSGAHVTNIDGVNITLPGNLRYFKAGNHDGIVDIQTGTIAKDLSNVQIHTEVVGGHSVMVYTDTAGNHVSGDPIADFAQMHVTIKPVDPIAGTQTAEIWTPTTAHTQMVEGHQVMTPGGATWEEDATHPGMWDLKATDNNGRTITLIDDAQFGTNGQIISKYGVHSGVTIVEGTSQITGGGVTVEQHDVIGTDGQWDATSGSYAYKFAKGSYDTEHSMHDYVDRNANGDVVYIVRVNPVTGPTTSTSDGTAYSIPDAIANNQLGFAIQIPGHGTHLVPPNVAGTAELRLDPTDTHTFKLSNSSTMTYGELAKMIINQDALEEHQVGLLGTSVNNRPDALFLGSEDGRPGTINSVIVDRGVLDNPIDGSRLIVVQTTIGTALATGNHIDVSQTGPSQTVFTPPTITADAISDVTGTIPQFESIADSAVLPLVIPGMLPIPVGRENIEKAEYGGSDSTTTTGAATPQTQQVATTNESAVSISAIQPEQIAASLKLTISDKDKEKKDGYYQTKFLPLITELDAVIASGDPNKRIEDVMRRLTIALKTCGSKQWALDAQRVERAIREAQKKMGSDTQSKEYKERKAAIDLEEAKNKAEIARATAAMEAMGVKLTPNEVTPASHVLKVKDSARAEHFYTIMDEVKRYIIAFDKSDAAAIAASGEKLKKLLRSEWRMTNSKEQVESIAALQAKLDAESDKESAKATEALKAEVERLKKEKEAENLARQQLEATAQTQTADATATTQTQLPAATQETQTGTATAAGTK